MIHEAEQRGEYRATDYAGDPPGKDNGRRGFLLPFGSFGLQRVEDE
jgi:hypothetical protein